MGSHFHWRSVKYEEIYLKDYATVAEAGIRRYFEFYNRERLHQSLGYRTPYEVHYANDYEPRLGLTFPPLAHRSASVRGTRAVDKVWKGRKVQRDGPVPMRLS